MCRPRPTISGTLGVVQIEYIRVGLHILLEVHR